VLFLKGWKDAALTAKANASAHRRRSAESGASSDFGGYFNHDAIHAAELSRHQSEGYCQGHPSSSGLLMTPSPPIGLHSGGPSSPAFPLSLITGDYVLSNILYTQPALLLEAPSTVRWIKAMRQSMRAVATLMRVCDISTYTDDGHRSTPSNSSATHALHGRVRVRDFEAVRGVRDARVAISIHRETAGVGGGGRAQVRAGCGIPVQSAAAPGLATADADAGLNGDKAQATAGLITWTCRRTRTTAAAASTTRQATSTRTNGSSSRSGSRHNARSSFLRAGPPLVLLGTSSTPNVPCIQTDCGKQ
jgi:hypothetical protein